MRTAGTECRGTGNRLYGQFFHNRLFTKEHFLQTLGIELIHVADKGLADAVDSSRLDLLLHEALQFLNDVECLHFGGKLPDQVHGQRIGKAELQERGICREDVLRILISDGGGDDAGFCPLKLHPIQRRAVAVLLQRGEIPLHLGVVLVGIRRGADVLFCIALISIRFGLFPLAEGHKTLGVGDAGGGTEQDRHVEFLRDPIRFLHEIDALLGIGGLDQGDLGGTGIVPVVLLVLGRVHAWIVCRDDHETAVDTVVGGGKKRVGSNVQTDMLHCAEAAHAADGSAIGDLCGHFFIRRPLTVQGILILGQRLKNLRTGSAWICGTDLNPGFIGTSRDCLVAGEQMFGHRIILRF